LKLRFEVVVVELGSSQLSFGQPYGVVHEYLVEVRDHSNRPSAKSMIILRANFRHLKLPLIQAFLGSIRGMVGGFGDSNAIPAPSPQTVKMPHTEQGLASLSPEPAVALHFTFSTCKVCRISAVLSQDYLLQSTTGHIMPLTRDQEGHTYVVHNNGQRTHYVLDDFTDPWKEPETILIQHGFGRHAEFWYHWV
jgi:hypothetical protein